MTTHTLGEQPNSQPTRFLSRERPEADRQGCFVLWMFVIPLYLLSLLYGRCSVPGGHGQWNIPGEDCTTDLFIIITQYQQKIRIIISNPQPGSEKDRETERERTRMKEGNRRSRADSTYYDIERNMYITLYTYTSLFIRNMTTRPYTKTPTTNRTEQNRT